RVRALISGGAQPVEAPPTGKCEARGARGAQGRLRNACRAINQPREGSLRAGGVFPSRHCIGRSEMRGSPILLLLTLAVAACGHEQKPTIVNTPPPTSTVVVP